jgi:hypothetical protein
MGDDLTEVLARGLHAVMFPHSSWLGCYAQDQWREEARKHVEAARADALREAVDAIRNLQSDWIGELGRGRARGLSEALVAIDALIPQPAANRYAEGFQAGVEAAARIADDLDDPYDQPSGRYIAERIRALAVQEPTPPAPERQFDWQSDRPQEPTPPAEPRNDPHRYAVVSADFTRPFLLGAYQTLAAATLAQCGSPAKWPIYERVTTPPAEEER